MKGAFSARWRWLRIPSSSTLPTPTPSSPRCKSFPSPTRGPKTFRGGHRQRRGVQPGTGLLWEVWLAHLTTSTSRGGSGAKWDTKTNSLRPLDATSADAAGLAMFGGLVRFDECQRGMVQHACRLVVG